MDRAEMPLPYYDADYGTFYRHCLDRPLMDMEWEAGYLGQHYESPEGGDVRLKEIGNYTGADRNCKPCEPGYSASQRSQCAYVPGLDCLKNLAMNGTEWGCACTHMYGFGGTGVVNGTCSGGTSVYPHRVPLVQFCYYGGVLLTALVFVLQCLNCVRASLTLRSFLPAFKLAKKGKGKKLPKGAVKITAPLGRSVCVMPIASFLLAMAVLGELGEVSMLDGHWVYGTYFRAPLKGIASVISMNVMLGIANQWIEVAQASMRMQKLDPSNKLTRATIAIRTVALFLSAAVALCYVMGQLVLGATFIGVIQILFGSSYLIASKKIGGMLTGLVKGAKDEKTKAKFQKSANNMIRCGGTIAMGSFISIFSWIYIFIAHDSGVVWFDMTAYPIYAFLLDGSMWVILYGCVRFNVTQLPAQFRKSSVSSTKVRSSTSSKSVSSNVSSSATSSVVNSEQRSSVGHMSSTSSNDNNSSSGTSVSTASSSAPTSPSGSASKSLK